MSASNGFAHRGRLVRGAIPLFAAIAVVAGLLLPVGAVSQSTNNWELGPKKFSNIGKSAAPLSIKSRGRSSLGTFAFVGKVGGVNFEAVAVPSPELANDKISVFYDPTQPDGRRLIAKIGRDEYQPLLPDWQMKPIALFANSDTTGVVSLFGEGPDTENYYYISYHEAFKDTLLGLRLLQSDILFIDLESNWKLPKWNGSTVVGLGESNTEEASALPAKQVLRNVLAGQNWQSWVLTDTETRPTIKIQGKRLIISASPYYYFWIVNPNIEAENQGNINKFNSILRSYAKKGEKYEMLADQHDLSINSYNEKVGLYNSTTNQSIRRSLVAELNSLKAALDYSEGVLKRLMEELDRDNRLLDELQERIENRPVDEVAELTRDMRSNDKYIQEYNPAVYQSYYRTAKFAAFFRYAKESDPLSWRRFIAQMNGLTIKPTVKTPIKWER